LLGWGRLRVGPAAYSTGNGDHGRSNAVPRHQNLGLDCRLGFLGVTTLLTIVSTITDKMAGFVYVALAAIYMLLTGKAKAAIVFTGRVGGHHPTAGIPGKDFSCFSKWARLYRHSVFWFVSFLSIYYHLEAKSLLPILVVFTVIVLLDGPSRVHVQVHFPSDVLDRYLLGGIWFPAIIPVFLFLKNSRWLSFQ
jgi:hypothetical protein